MPVQTSYSNDLSAAYSGQLISAPDGGIMSMIQAEASASMVPGRAVAFKPSGLDKEATIPTNATDRICGILLRSHAYEHQSNGDLDENGDLVPGANLNVLAIGECWVKVEDAVVPGDRLWVRRVAGGDPEFLGNLLPADDSSDTIDCTSQGVFLTTASAGGLARLRVNFTAKQADAA